MPRFRSSSISRNEYYDGHHRFEHWYRDDTVYFITARVQACLRNEKQGRRTWKYVHTQCLRHGICDDPKGYPHTHVNVELERAVKRSIELDAYMVGVPYKRYGQGKRSR